VQNRFVNEASEFGYKDKYDDLYKCSILKQGSLFADLNDLEDTGLTETADLDKLKGINLVPAFLKRQDLPGMCDPIWCERGALN